MAKPKKKKRSTSSRSRSRSRSRSGASRRSGSSRKKSKAKSRSRSGSSRWNKMTTGSKTGLKILDPLKRAAMEAYGVGPGRTGHKTTVATNLTLTRDVMSKGTGDAFVACFNLGRSGGQGPGTKVARCATGRNPRAAMAAAFRAVATDVSHRRGTLAGLGLVGGRRRRRRRR